jgi:DNA-binding transcriptional LysR family regulator
MELMQLEMLVAVAEEHSFLRAAERVFRTQPAVSIGLRKLEGRIGVPLIDRSSRRGGRLTPAGERLYEYARKILVLRDEALSVVKREDRPSEGTLRVGLVGDESLNHFPALWNWFKERHPGVEVKLHSDSLGTVLDELVDGRLDVALVSGRPRCDGQSKSLVVTRVRDVPGHGWFWVVRQRLGRTPLAHEFERILRRNVSPRVRVSNAKTIGIGLSRIRVVR